MRREAAAEAGRTLALVLVAVACLWRAPADASPCAGDCNVEGFVTRADLLTGVNIALRAQDLSACLSFDQNDDQAVTIGEIVAGVARAMTDCRADYTQASSGIVTSSVDVADSLGIIDFGGVANPAGATTLARGGTSAAGGDFSSCLCPDGGAAFAFCNVDGQTSVLSAFLSACREGGTVRNGQMTLTVATADFCGSCFIPPGVDATQVLETGFTIASGSTVAQVTEPLTEAFQLNGSACAGANRAATYDGTLRFNGPGTDRTYEYRALGATISSGQGNPCTTTTTKVGQAHVNDRVANRRFLETSDHVVVTETARMNGRHVTLDTPSGSSLRIDCLGKVLFSTLTPLFFPTDVTCPTDGLVQVTFLNQTSVTASRYSSGVDFDLDFHPGQFNVDEHFADCKAAAIKQCTVPLPIDPNAPPVERALQYLSIGNLHAANATLSDVLKATPDDAEANLLFAATRLPTTFLENPQIGNLLQRSGIVLSGDSTDVCSLSGQAPNYTPSNPPPPGAPGTGEIIDTVRAVMLPELTGARQNLARVPAATVIPFLIHHLPPCLRPTSDRPRVDLDQGDVLMFDAGLAVMAGALDLLTAYNLDVSQTTQIPLAELVSSHPSLLKLRSAARLAAARSSVDAAFTSTIQGINEILAESDNQSNDLITIDPQDASGFQEQLLPILALLQQSLGGEVTIPIDVVTGQFIPVGTPGARLNLDPLFSGQFASLRGFLQPIDAGHFSGPVPDPTFGGTLPDMTATKLANFFIGGPACAPCDSDRDCNPIEVRHGFSCNDCQFNCTGTTRRCAFGPTQCSDGTFDGL